MSFLDSELSSLMAAPHKALFKMAVIGIVFFSSLVPKEFENYIKSDTSVIPCIGALREMNLESFPIDNQIR
ncbi:hypothetical protein RGQ29_021856 [Quercus rubra]|uniref:Uncharacterized protein n=1 Tax=Quercus rubra TaxID=3512 RepID=A0AAN7IRN4_QUERU|nr:hypothetical protein RGQ29_021856 [Quercus rubra]